MILVRFKKKKNITMLNANHVNELSTNKMLI